MEETIVKPIIRVGNSAGVVLPIEWYGGEARIELIKKPLNLKEDIFKILDDYMHDISGVYLVGSYARGEEGESSDIDVLVITSEINKRIRKGKYDIILISRNEIDKGLKIVVPLVPMIREAIPLMNKYLLENLGRKQIRIKDLKWHIETTKSSLNLIKNLLILSDKKVNGNIIYPLILRLRQVYIIDCLLKNKKYSTKDFLEILKRNKIHELYEGYQKEKNDKKAKLVDKEKAEIAYNLILKYLDNYGKEKN